MLELLIAVSVFAIVLAAINAVFFSAMRLRNRAVAQMEQNLPVEHALAIIRRDLLNLVPPGTNLLGPLQTSASTNSIPGVAGPVFFCASGIVDEYSPWPDVQKVAYALAESTNRFQGRDLVRYAVRNLLATTPEQPLPQLLLSRVESITFSFHDGSQWRDYWDSTVETPNLPRGIRVQIQRLPEDDDANAARPVPLQMVIPVMVVSSTNSTASATPLKYAGQRNEMVPC